MRKLILRDGRSFTIDDQVLGRLTEDLLIYGSPLIAERGIPPLTGGIAAAGMLLNAYGSKPVLLEGEASDAVESLLTGYGFKPSPASDTP